MKRQKNLCSRLLMMLAVMFFALDVSAQATINGHVKDETGEGVIGASVMVKMLIIKTSLIISII